MPRGGAFLPVCNAPGRAASAHTGGRDLSVARWGPFTLGSVTGSLGGGATAERSPPAAHAPSAVAPPLPRPRAASPPAPACPEDACFPLPWHGRPGTAGTPRAQESLAPRAPPAPAPSSRRQLPGSASPGHRALLPPAPRGVESEGVPGTGPEALGASGVETAESRGPERCPFSLRRQHGKPADVAGCLAPAT